MSKQKSRAERLHDEMQKMVREYERLKAELSVLQQDCKHEFNAVTVTDQYGRPRKAMRCPHCFLVK